jgi:hypothetical protein
MSRSVESHVVLKPTFMPVGSPKGHGYSLRIADLQPRWQNPGGRERTDFAAAGVEGAWLAARAENARSACVEIYGNLGQLDKWTDFKGFLAYGGA